jgi:small subunit ribosomal protein S17
MPKRILKGEVVKVSGTKTIKVKVASRKAHPLLGKVITTTKNYLAHDENAVAKVGDNVSIQESRPLSKLKRWVLIND